MIEFYETYDMSTTAYYGISRGLDYDMNGLKKFLEGNDFAKRFTNAICTGMSFEEPVATCGNLGFALGTSTYDNFLDVYAYAYVSVYFISDGKIKLYSRNIDATNYMRELKKVIKEAYEFFNKKTPKKGFTTCGVEAK